MRSCLCFALVLVSSAPLAAQTLSDHGSGLGRNEAMVGLGLTMPFGGARAEERAPRVELRVARDTVDPDGSRRTDRSLRRQEVRVGLAFDRDRTLIVNGRALQTRREMGISDLGWVAIGVGTVLVVGGLVLNDALNDASD